MGLFSTFEAVEILKRDATIATLTAENERLRKDMPVSFGNLTFDVLRLTAENERLRNDLRDWAECASVSVTMGGPRLMGWNQSALNRCLAKYEVLQPKEGNQ